MAIPAGVDTIEKGYDIVSLNRYLTFNLISIQKNEVVLNGNPNWCQQLYSFELHELQLFNLNH